MGRASRKNCPPSNRLNLLLDAGVSFHLLLAGGPRNRVRALVHGIAQRPLHADLVDALAKLRRHLLLLALARPLHLLDHINPRCPLHFLLVLLH